MSHLFERLVYSLHMTETRTLHFENARHLQSLYANDLQLLKNGGSLGREGHYA